MRSKSVSAVVLASLTLLLVSLRAAPARAGDSSKEKEVGAADKTPARPRAASPLGEALLKLVGTAGGLPEDMAAQHDHYLHGTPKR